MRVAMRMAVGLLLLAGIVTGCRHASSSASSTVAADVKVYPIRGKIVSVDAAKGMIVLDHEAVPGFMDAMTMPYKLKDSSVASALHPGDRITAKVLVSTTADGDDDAVLDQIVVTAEARPDFKPTGEPHIPTAGDAVPDFKLVNENGRTIHLAQFKGQVVLLTFVYTRCPLPDYCIRMSRNFAQIDKALASDPALYAKTHLLSVSFDPKTDTPAVLKSYGETYVGVGASAKFAHWDFAVPPTTKELDAMTQFFDVGISAGDGGLITHSMSTAVIGRDGKIRAWYATNEWTTDEVLAAIKSAAIA